MTLKVLFLAVITCCPTLVLPWKNLEKLCCRNQNPFQIMPEGQFVQDVMKVLDDQREAMSELTPLLAQRMEQICPEIADCKAVAKRETVTLYRSRYFLPEFIKQFEMKRVVVFQHKSDPSLINTMQSEFKDKYKETVFQVFFDRNYTEIASSTVPTAFVVTSNYLKLAKIVQDVSENLSFQDIMLIKGPISLEEIPPWLSLKINRRIFTYENTGNGYVKVHEIYRIADDWPVKSNFVGVFSPASGLIFTKKIIWDRRKDLDGYLIHCATESDAPFIDWHPEKPGETVGFLSEVWKIQAKRNSFTFDFVKSIDGNFGGRFPNGSYNGLVGMAERHDVDAAIAGLGLFYDRALVADYSYPVTRFRVVAFIKAGGQEETDFYTYIKPYTLEAWILYLSLFLICIFAYHLQSRFDVFEFEDETWTFGQSVMMVVHCFFQQGSEYVSWKYSLRIAFLTIFLSGMTCLFCYGACLTSFLAAKVIKLPFANTETLYSKSDYNMITVAGTAIMDTFKHGTPIQRKIFKERFITSSSFKEAWQIFLTQPKLALYWQDVSIYGLESCDYLETNIFFDVPLVHYHPKNWAYTEILNYQLLEMREDGVLDIVAKKWLPQKITHCNDNDTVEPLGYRKLISLFIFVFSALLITWLLLGCEILVHKDYKNGLKGRRRGGKRKAGGFKFVNPNGYKKGGHGGGLGKGGFSKSGKINIKVHL